MRKIPIIIDCDPGVDDIAALILAKQIECFDVKAVTTVAGNVKRKHTTRNALRVLDFLKWDIPVGKGAKSPLACPLQTAEEFHGKGGMSGLSLPKTDKKPEKEAAWDLIYRIAGETRGELDIVAIGPLTNIAIALAKYPELVDWIHRIVIMGGAILAGNTTPAAEFNICVDPEAAKRVFTSGVPFYLCPLDVTHEGYITSGDLDDISRFGSKEAVFFADIIRPYLALASIYSGGRGAALHDPLALLFAADNSYFEYEECFIGVETLGSLTRGKTVTDCYSDKQLDNNGFLVKTVDRDVFIKQVKGLLLKY
jgi:inosine-uridine nucleoside N-ribohydrolase